jgi:hypothetical protein
MNGTQMQDGLQQLDLQGFIGAWLGRALGGWVGNQIGGSTGRTIGSVAGGFAGGLAPLSTGPAQQGQPTDLEMQGFLSVLRRIAQGVGQGVDIGRSLGLFGTGLAQQGQPSDLEMQGFLSVLQRLDFIPPQSYPPSTPQTFWRN